MERESPAEVATTFLERFGDGEFDEADALVHPEGPLDGAGDVAALFSILATDFLATVVLGAIPTTVTETTIIEEGPTTASVDASLDVADVIEFDVRVELRPSDSDGSDPGDGRREEWRVWNVDVGS